MATMKSDDTRRKRQPGARRAEEAAPSGTASPSPEAAPPPESQARLNSPAAMGLPTPEAALGLWMSWMKQNVGGFGQTGGTEQPWWVANADALSGTMLASGVEQFQSFLAADPMLASIDRMWNANPLREVIPVDWAEAVRALRIVWLRSLRDPAKAFTRSAELNMQIWTSAMEAWNSAGARWWGLTTGTTPDSGAERRQALRRAGVERQSGLPDAEGNVSAGFRLPAAAGAGGHRHGPEGA